MLEATSPLADAQVFQAACAYLSGNLSLIPIKPDGTKSPYGLLLPWDDLLQKHVWKPYQAQLPSHEELINWFAMPTGAGIGIVCGSISGNLEILDFDQLDVYDLWAELVRDVAPDLLAKLTLLIGTPKPGRHVYYRCARIEGNQKLAWDSDGKTTLIETRGHGGYVLAPGSPLACHPSGRPYEVLKGITKDQSPEEVFEAIPTITTEERDILLGLARSFNRYTPPAQTPPSPRVNGTVPGDRPGDEFNARASWDEVLTPSGWTVTGRCGEATYWKRPGKTEPGHSAITGNGDDRLCVFTSNAAPLEPYGTRKKTYSKFEAYTALYHGGDFSAAAKTLAARGYGRNGQPYVLTNGTPPDPPSHAAQPSSDTDEEVHLTDVGNGLRLVQQFGHDLRYVTTWDKWLVWDEGRWKLDAARSVEWHSKQVIGSLYHEAKIQIEELTNGGGRPGLSQDDREKALAAVMATLKWAHTSESHSHIETMVKRARVNPAIQVDHKSLDANAMLFQVINGTVDLTTGTLLAPRRSDLITKQSPVVYDPDAICPLWITFLQRVLGFPGPEDPITQKERDRRIKDADAMMTYLKRLVGMSLTADITEQILLFLYGTGNNGKSTFLNIILTLMGEYGMQAAPNFLLVREHEQHPTELSDLFGKRYASTIEIEKGKHLAEALMKMLTGSEEVRARRMREDFWQFPPTWKIWFCANDKPKVKGRDKATWRRIKLIPFEVTIPDKEVDHDLPKKLLDELPGILNWAIEGCLEWKQHGLQEPKKVTQATQAYREETDLLAQFAKECCICLPSLKTQSSMLHRAFERYTGQSVSPVEFADIMAASGYKKKPIGGRVYWIGIGLIATTDDDSKTTDDNSETSASY